MKIDLFNSDGEKLKSIDVSKDIQIEFHSGLVHQMVLYQMNRARKPIAQTKTRGMVRGGGRKPWKQKGTGRARSGSIRNPIFRGGGVVFGPTGTENYSFRLNKKQRRKALLCCLSEKIREQQVVALDSFDVKEKKTQVFAKMLSNLGVDRDALFVVNGEIKDIVMQASANISSVKVIQYNYLNVVDIMKYKKVVFLEEAFASFQEEFVML